MQAILIYAGHVTRDHGLVLVTQTHPSGQISAQTERSGWLTWSPEDDIPVSGPPSRGRHTYNNPFDAGNDNPYGPDTPIRYQGKHRTEGN